MAYLAAMARTPPTDNTEGAPGSCAVLVSIHQPRAAIWDMFDKVGAFRWKSMRGYAQSGALCNGSIIAADGCANPRVIDMKCSAPGQDIGCVRALTGANQLWIFI